MSLFKIFPSVFSYKAMLLLIFCLSVMASSSTEDPLAGHRCTFIKGDDGFKCLNGGGCIPLKWVCDDEEQVRAGHVEIIKEYRYILMEMI